MKKSLSLILALAMVFSMFASVAFAADTETTDTDTTTEQELTVEEKYAALEELGIFEGDGTGANLQGEMTRAQLAKIVTLLLQLDEDAAANTYTDVSATHWAAGFIGAATKANIFDGRAPGQFDPEGEVSYQELATVLVRVTGLAQSTDEVEGVVDTWAKGYVAAAVKELGLTQDDYTANAIRGVFVELTYAALPKVPAPAQEIDVKAVGAKKFEVTFQKAVNTSNVGIKVLRNNIEQSIDGDPVWNEAKTVATITLAAKFQTADYTVEVSGVTNPAFTKTLSLEQEKVAKIEFPTDKAPFVRDSNNEQIEIYYNVFNQYGEKVNSTYTINFNASRGSITNTEAGKFVLDVDPNNTDAGYFTLNENVIVNAYFSDYTIGSFATAQQTFVVSPEAKVASVKIVELYNEDGATPTVGDDLDDYTLNFTVEDQYGNPVTSRSYIADDVQVFASNPLIFTFEKTSGKIPVANLTLDGDTGVFSLELANSNGGEEFETAGTNTVSLYAIYYNANDTLDVTVTEGRKVANFTLSTPDVAAAGEEIEIPYTATDKNGNALGSASDFNLLSETVTFNSIASTSLPNASIKFEADGVNNKTKLILDVSDVDVTKDTPKIVYINASVNPNTIDYKLATLSLTLKPNAVPDTIIGLADTAVALAVGEKGATTTVVNDDIKVVDQYNRTYAIHKNLYKGYKVKVETADSSILTVSGDGYITKDVSSLTLTAVKKGTTKLTLTLVDNDGTTVLDSSAKSFNLKVVNASDIVDFEVATIAPLYVFDTQNPPGLYGASDDGSNYQKSVTVTGLLSDGTKVSLGTDDGSLYSVQTATYGVEYASGKLTATTSLKKSGGILYDVDGNPTTAQGKIIVNVTKGGTTNDIIEKEITVSSVAPTPTTLVVRDVESKATVIGTNYVSLVKDKYTGAGKNTYDAAYAFVDEVVKNTDQYSVVLAKGSNYASRYLSITFSNLLDANGDAKTGTGYDILANATASGDTFTVTVVTKNSVVYTFKAVIE